MSVPSCRSVSVGRRAAAESIHKHQHKMTPTKGTTNMPKGDSKGTCFHHCVFGCLSLLLLCVCRVVRFLVGTAWHCVTVYYWTPVLCTVLYSYCSSIPFHSPNGQPPSNTPPTHTMSNKPAQKQKTVWQKVEPFVLGGSSGMVGHTTEKSPVPPTFFLSHPSTVDRSPSYDTMFLFFPM